MLRTSVLTLVIALALSACASDETEPDSTTTPTVSESPATPTQLAFGDAESVEWSAGGVTGELSIRVERVREGDFDDFAGLEGSGITADNQPFYVDATIINEGETDLGGIDVPLYLQDSNQVLNPPWGFAEPFKPCPSGPLPAPFATDDEVETCLVFFGSPGATFQSVLFQPTLDSTAVTWTGDLTVPTRKPIPKKKRQKR